MFEHPEFVGQYSTMLTEISDPVVLVKEPLVSVNMVTYNHSSFIAKAIEGVMHQKTTFPIELVIGEDCSTDDTRNIILEYQKKYPNIIRLIFSETNVGLKKNGYRTIRACRGRYISFCEGDDYWQNPNKLQLQCDYIEANPDCGLVYSSYDVHRVKDNILIRDFIRHRKWQMPDDPDLESFFADFNRFGGKRPEILTCTVMMKRRLWEHIVESDPYLHQSEHFLMGDTQIWVETAKLARLHYIEESLATHVITEESATRSKDLKKVLRFLISNADLMLYLSNKYCMASHISERYSRYKGELELRLAYWTRDSKKAQELMREKRIYGWRDWARYMGTRNRVFYEVYRMLAFLKNIFRKENDEWT